MMSKLISFISAIALAACALTATANVDLVKAFSAQASSAPLTVCDIPSQPVGSAPWCSCYVNDAVTACNNGWSQGSCTTSYQGHLIKQTAGDPPAFLNVICSQQLAAGHLPAGITQASCVSEMQAYASQC